MNNKLSIISTIEDALTRFLGSYGEYPNMVLLGPPEMSGLIEEMVAMQYDMMPTEHQFHVCDMLIVPKVTPGIDFQISVKLSQNLSPENRKKFIAEEAN